ncbi:MAG: response regulator [Deferribacteraceae bacterium]|jgi:CheY-like chemotaxis protein|nr:response regulator [Deferribacteraceae bacterium]
MDRRKRLFEISDLKIAGKLENFNELQFDEYCRKLSVFIDNFPEQEEKLKTTLTAKDYTSFAKHLLIIQNMLEEIYADDIAKNCQKLLGGLSNVSDANHEKFETYMSYFLANLSVLSIDILMSEHKEQTHDSVERTKEKTTPGGVQKSILAVDDQDMFLLVMKSFLKDSPYKLTCLASGADALNYLKKNRPDMFILDIMMPEMDGYELAQKIRESGHKAPIIFLTGNYSKEAILKAIKAGGSDFIVKPATKEQVLTRILRFI